MNAQAQIRPSQTEGYVDVGSEQLYYTLLTPVAPRLAVVCVGTFPSERTHSHVGWNAWFRALAADGIAALRFDYRGSGESSGRFERHAFSDWLEDVYAAAAVLGEYAPDVPVVLHGYRMGALLAARAFERGLGRALLLWSPPKSARDMLFDLLRFRLMADLAHRKTDGPKERSVYVAELAAGRTVEVEGYMWAKKLWDEADGLVVSAHDSPQRPVRTTVLGSVHGPLGDPYGRGLVQPKGSRARAREWNVDLSGLFAPELAWLHEASGQIARRQERTG
jgi:alpha/beta superfamily hydrolase